MLPTIFLSLYNKELERRHIEAKEAERQAQLDAERLQREQFITELGLTGCQIFGVGETVHGPVIRLTDGRELFMGGRLRDLRVRRPETPNSLT